MAVASSRLVGLQCPAGRHKRLRRSCFDLIVREATGVGGGKCRECSCDDAASIFSFATKLHDESEYLVRDALGVTFRRVDNRHR